MAPAWAALSYASYRRTGRGKVETHWENRTWTTVCPRAALGQAKRGMLAESGEGQVRTRREHHTIQLQSQRFRDDDVAAPRQAAHSCWRQNLYACHERHGLTREREVRRQ